jgi:hypothetical protein
MLCYAMLWPGFCEKFKAQVVQSGDILDQTVDKREWVLSRYGRRSFSPGPEKHKPGNPTTSMRHSHSPSAIALRLRWRRRQLAHPLPPPPPPPCISQTRAAAAEYVCESLAGMARRSCCRLTAIFSLPLFLCLPACLPACLLACLPACLPPCLPRSLSACSALLPLCSP